MSVLCCYLIFFTGLCSVLAQVDGVEDLLLVLGGGGEPSVALFNQACDRQCVVDIPDIPQAYGSPGRTGSYAAILGDTVLVCGGLDDAGPPISSFKDCQGLNLHTLSWTASQMGNYSANGVSVQISPDQFTIFGGENTRYDGPSPTEWVDHNQIQHLDTSGDTGAEWVFLDQLTLNNDSFLGSCAVVHDDKVWMTDGVGGSTLLSFSLETQEWEVVFPDIGFSAKRHGCVVANVNGEDNMIFLGGDNDLAAALNLATGYTILLPQPAYRRPYRPILNVIGAHLVAHGGGFAGENFLTEETLKLDDFGSSGWEGRTVGDRSRINSPAVVVTTEFFPDCSCDQ